MANRRLTKSLWSLATVVCLLSSSGATCKRQMMMNPFAAPGPAAPQVLMEGASREQIIAAVNQNSSRIQSLTVTGATITIPDMLGLPLLSGNIAAERPGRFRLTAGTAVTGQEIDLGSNDELFWMWVRRNQPPAVYFCRHSQFANSNIRQVMPVEPCWLLAALGMVDIDPASVFDGPLPARRWHGRAADRGCRRRSARLQRVTSIDARRAWVVEQHIYDQSGTTLLASAVAESHRYYPVEQVSLPDRLSIRLPTADMQLQDRSGRSADQPANGRPAAALDAADVRRLSAIRSGRRDARHAAARPAGRHQSAERRGAGRVSIDGYPATPYPVTPAAHDQSVVEHGEFMPAADGTAPLPVVWPAAFNRRAQSAQRDHSIEHRHDAARRTAAAADLHRQRDDREAVGRQLVHRRRRFRAPARCRGTAAGASDSSASGRGRCWPCRCRPCESRRRVTSQSAAAGSRPGKCSLATAALPCSAVPRYFSRSGQ